MIKQTKNWSFFVLTWSIITGLVMSKYCLHEFFIASLVLQLMSV